MADSDNQRTTTGRDANGRFTFGNSGRPFGAKGKTSREALASVKSLKDEALEKLRQGVQLGERWAIEYVLSRVLPQSRTIEFEELSSDDIKAALIAGDLSPDEGRTLVSVLRQLRELEDLDTLKKRLEELENAVATK